MKYFVHIMTNMAMIMLYSQLYGQDTSSNKPDNSYNLLGIEEYKSKSNVLRLINGKTLSLIPTKIVSEINKTYYVLKLQYDPNKWNLRVYAGDKMDIYINGHPISLQAHNVHSSTSEVVAFYDIEMLDLIEIGNADSVNVRIFDISGFTDFVFTDKNIKNIQDFVTEHILAQDPELNKTSPQKQKKGFISLGVGTGIEMWTAMYNTFKKRETVASFTDFIAIGIGYTFFIYDVLRILYYSPEPHYYSKKKENVISIVYFNAMYGFTFPKKIGSWPLEIALTAQYYIVDVKHWDKNYYFNNRNVQVPKYKYEVTTGKPYQGFAAGIFIQAGSFWFRINHQKAWTLGYSFPAYF